MSVSEPSHRVATALALLVTVMWSSSWVLIRWGLDDEGLDPLTFAALRYGLASLILLSVVFTRPNLRGHITSIGGGSMRRMVVLGIVFYSLTQGAQFVAIDQQPAATTSLLLSWTPLLVALVSAWTLSEAPSPRQLAGAGLVVLGAWLYFSGDLGATVAGMVAAIVALSSNTFGSILGRRVNRDEPAPPIVVTAVSMAIGSLILTVVGLTLEGVPHLGTRAWLIIAWLSIVNTALAFTLWNASLRRLSALESAGINNTMLIQIALLAWWFLGERPDALALAGIVVVSLGILFTQASGTVRAKE